jgi:hypothetical protein
MKRRSGDDQRCEIYLSTQTRATWHLLHILKNEMGDFCENYSKVTQRLNIGKPWAPWGVGPVDDPVNVDSMVCGVPLSQFVALPAHTSQRSLCLGECFAPPSTTDHFGGWVPKVLLWIFWHNFHARSLQLKQLWFQIQLTIYMNIFESMKNVIIHNTNVFQHVIPCCWISLTHVLSHVYVSVAPALKF